MRAALALALGAALPAGEAAAPPPLPAAFAVDLAVGEGEHALAQRVVRDGDRWRVESRQGGTTRVVIHEPGGSTLILDESSRTALRTTGVPRVDPLAGLAGAWTRDGEEKVAGRACARWRLRPEQGPERLVWIDARGLPLRVAVAAGGAGIRCDGWDLDQPDERLFAPPEGWRVVERGGPR